MNEPARIAAMRLGLAGPLAADPRGPRNGVLPGRSRSYIDPWDDNSLNSARGKHIEIYTPEGFHVLNSIPSRIRPIYEHTLYEKDSH